MPNITNITPPRVPLVDTRTGLVSREWYRFFLNLFTLTGGGVSSVTIPELSVLVQRSGSMPGLDGNDGEDGQMGIPGQAGPQGVAGQFVPGIDGADGEDAFLMGFPSVIQEADIGMNGSYENSWADYGAPYAVGAYFKDSLGIVRLKGMIASGTVTAVAFTLPAGYRPSEARIFIAASNGGVGIVQIGTNGAITIVAGSNVYVSLDGISFRV